MIADNQFSSRGVASFEGCDMKLRDPCLGQVLTAPGAEIFLLSPKKPDDKSSATASRNYQSLRHHSFSLDAALMAEPA